MLKKVVVGLLIFSVLIFGCTVAIAILADEDEKSQRDAERAADKQKGFHCLSSWTDTTTGWSGW